MSGVFKVLHASTGTSRCFPGDPVAQVQPLGQEDSPGEGSGNPLEYCLGRAMDRGAWQAYSLWGHKRVGHNLATKQQV